MEDRIKTGNQHLIEESAIEVLFEIINTSLADVDLTQSPDFSSTDEEKKLTLVRAWKIRSCEPKACQSHFPCLDPRSSGVPRATP